MSSKKRKRGSLLRKTVTTSSCLRPNNNLEYALSCGSYYVACITENDDCYVWGDNTDRQLGKFIGFRLTNQFEIGVTTTKWKITIPTKITLPNNEKLSFISCGAFHTACITSNGSCYIWGFNKYGQLGSEDKVVFMKDVNISKPSLLILPKSDDRIIRYISCGASHTACITTNENCYIWGFNRYGQLGLGDRISRNFPTLLQIQNETIRNIICKGWHTACLTKSDRCYLWGCEEYGRLGNIINTFI